MPQRAVLFGGTFDPVHHGHLIAARCIAEQRSFERITFVPAGRSPHKAPACAPAADRLAMLRLAVEGEAAFDVSDAETRRDGPSYTLETLLAFRRELGSDAKLHLVVGADMLADLPNWHRARELVELADIVVALRPPWHLRMDDILADLSRRFRPEVVERLARGVVRTPVVDISATDVRCRVAAGRSIRYLVPDAVADYIRTRGLYADRAADRPARPAAH